MTSTKRLGPAAYLVAFSLVAIPLFDAATSTRPLHLHDPRWRFGAVGVVSNAMLFPVFGALLAIVAATMLEHRRTRRLLAVLTFLGTAICLAALGLFVLDALQTHSGVRPEFERSFVLASITVAVKLVIFAAAFCAMGVAGITRQSVGSARRDVAPVQRHVPLLRPRDSAPEPAGDVSPS